MKNETIVLCFPVTDEQVKKIESSTQRNVKVSNQDDISKDIFEADIFCGHAKKEPIDWAGVTAKGRLRWIQSSAAGLDHCLAPEVIAADEIMVSGCSALFANQVAEQTMALLFGLIRSMPVFFRAQLKKEFVRRPTDELHGKTVGIVGFGGNGRRIAEVLRPFAAKIVATDCFANGELGQADVLLPPEKLSELLQVSDVVILTLPLTQANEGMFDDSVLSTMKPGSYLINVGRGSVVDHLALTRHLESGHIKATGFDVCEPEPLPLDHPLWDMPQVLISPHVGAQSKWRVPMTVELFCNNLERFDRQETLFNLVDKPLGFPRPEHRISAAHPMFSTILSS